METFCTCFYTVGTSDNKLHHLNLSCCLERRMGPSDNKLHHLSLSHSLERRMGPSNSTISISPAALKEGWVSQTPPSQFLLQPWKKDGSLKLHHLNLSCSLERRMGPSNSTISISPAALKERWVPQTPSSQSLHLPQPLPHSSIRGSTAPGLTSKLFSISTTPPASPPAGVVASRSHVMCSNPSVAAGAAGVSATSGTGDTVVGFSCSWALGCWWVRLFRGFGDRLRLLMREESTPPVLIFSWNTSELVCKVSLFTTDKKDDIWREKIKLRERDRAGERERERKRERERESKRVGGGRERAREPDRQTERTLSLSCTQDDKFSSQSMSVALSAVVSEGKRTIHTQSSSKLTALISHWLFQSWMPVRQTLKASPQLPTVMMSLWTCPLHVTTGVMHEAVTSSYLPHVGIPLGIFLELRETCEEKLDHVHQGVLCRLPQQLWAVRNHDRHDANNLRLFTALCNSIREQYFPYWASFL